MKIVYKFQILPCISGNFKKPKNRNAKKCWNNVVKKIPYIIRNPVNKWTCPTNELQMLCSAFLFTNQKNQKTRRNKRHSNHNKDGNNYISAGNKNIKRKSS